MQRQVTVRAEGPAETGYHSGGLGSLARRGMMARSALDSTPVPASEPGDAIIGVVRTARINITAYGGLFQLVQKRPFVPSMGVSSGGLVSAG